MEGVEEMRLKKEENEEAWLKKVEDRKTEHPDPFQNVVVPEEQVC